MKRSISNKLLVVLMACAFLVAYSVPFSALPGFDGGKQIGGVESVFADTIPDEAWNFDADTGELKGFASGSTYDNPTNLVIPAEIGGVKVKSIGNQAFQNSSSGTNKKIKNALTSITLPEGLEKIGRQAFQTGVKMTGDPITVTFPASLTFLDYRAFYGWDRIGEVRFAAGSQLETIGEAAFQGCSVLETVTLPDGLKTIDVDAFRDTSLKNISIPSSVETIGATAFALTLIKEFTLPANVTSWSKTKAGGDPTGTSVMFFRTAQNKAVSDSGYYSQGTLELTRVYDTTGQATPSNTGAVVNPQPVTIKYVDEEGNQIKEPDEAVGAEYNTVKSVQGTYSTQYYLDEGNGDGHLYFNYETPMQDTAKTDFYSNRVSRDENKDWAAVLIGGNYFTTGKEYTFKAPKISGYTEPTEAITKTITETDHEVTFVYKEAEKVDLVVEGEGITTDPAAGKVGVGSDVTATVTVPEGKKIDTFTVNDVDHVADLTQKDGKYTYQFELTEATTVKVTFKDLSHATVYLTVSNKGDIPAANDGKAMANREVDVVDLDGDEKFTFDEALVAAHKAYNSADGYNPGGGFVNKLWGVESTNNLFFINGQGLPNGVTVDTVEDNDYLLASINKDTATYSDWVSRLEPSDVLLATDEETEVTLTGHLGMAYDDEGKKYVPVEGVQLGIWDNEEFKAIDGAVTDENGKAKISFDKAGDYIVTAKGSVKGTATDWNLMKLGADVYGRMGSGYSMEVAYTDADYGIGPYPADEIKYIDYFEEADEDSDNDYAWEDLHYLKSNQLLVDSPLMAPVLNAKVVDVTTAKVDVRVNFEDGAAEMFKGLTVSSSDAYKAGIRTLDDPETISIADAIAAAHKKKYGDSFKAAEDKTVEDAQFVIEKTQLGAGVQKAFNVLSASVGMFINNSQDGVMSVADTISEGDLVAMGLYKDPYWGDKYLYFDADSYKTSEEGNVEVRVLAKDWSPAVPAEGVEVALTNGAEIVATATTDAEGKAVLEAVDPGTYAVEVVKSPYEYAWLPPIAEAEVAAVDELAKDAIAAIKALVEENKDKVEDPNAADIAALKAINDIRDAETIDEVRAAVKKAKETINKMVEDKEAADKKAAEEKAAAKKAAEEAAKAEAARKAAEEAAKYADVDKITPSDAAVDAAKVDKKLAIKTSGITTSAKTGKKTMTVKWKKVAGATNYRIAYRKAGAKKWTYKWSKGKNSVVLTKMKKNGLYEFKLQAVKKSGSTWTKSSFTKSNYRFYAITKQTVKAGKKAVTVKAKKVKGATGYEVLYSTKSSMKGYKVKKGKSTSIKVTGLKKAAKYYVQVRPVKKYKGKTYIGVLSAKKSAKVK